MPDLPVTQAQITIANVKDVPYTAQNGAAGTFKSIGHKQPDGTWLNLSCFDDALWYLLVPGQTLDVGYTEKWATMPNGQPKIDQRSGQQVVYRTIVSAIPVGGTAGAPPQQQTHSAAPGKAPYDPSLGAFQTALNCSTQLHAALIEAKLVKQLNLDDVLGVAGIFHRYLTTGNTELIDLMLATGPAEGETQEGDDEPQIDFAGGPQ